MESALGSSAAGKPGRVVAPVDFAADEITVGGLANTLAQLAREAELQDPQPLPIYGLGPDGEVVKFVAAGDEYALRLGIETPVGENAYVLAEGSGVVSIVPSWRVDSFRRSLDELRDARVLHFDRTALVGLSVRWSDGFAKLEKRGDGWWLVEPVAERADAHTVDTLLSDLSFLRAEGFADAPLSDAELGLDTPAYRVELSSDTSESAPAAGGPSVAAITVGAIYEDEFRLVRGSEKSLYRVPDRRIAELPRQLIDFRFKELSRFDSEQALRIEIEFAAADDALPASAEPTRVELVRQDGAWLSAEGPVDGEKVGQLLAELASLEASEILADAMGAEELAALGLDPPRVVLRVFGAAGAEAAPEVGVILGEVQLGLHDPAAGIVARAPHRDVIYRIASEFADQLPLDLTAYRERFPSPEP